MKELKEALVKIVFIIICIVVFLLLAKWVELINNVMKDSRTAYEITQNPEYIN